MNMLPMQPGNIPDAAADIALADDVGYAPDTPIETGIQRFIDWYHELFIKMS